MITVDIVDDTQIDSGSVYVTGHGIPGSTDGGQPSSLNVLGSQGKFVQAAVVISAASCSGTTATITTAVPNQVAANQTVFVSGVSVPGYNGVFQVTSVSGTSINYTVPAALPPATGGVVYLPVLISSQKIQAATGNGGIVTATLQGPANLPLNSPIQLFGLTGSGINWNGVWAVSQNPSTNPALGPSQFQVEISGASGNAGVAINAYASIVSLVPTSVAGLPQDSATYKPCIQLDQNIATFSAQLVVMVTPSGEAPFPIGVTPGTASLSNLAVPPFAPGQQAGNSVADIVEFYYAGSTGNSTFDVSQVDGFALPLTLQSSTVSSGPAQVGVNAALTGVNRRTIGQAFTSFLQNEPTDVQSVGQFGRLLYTGAVNANPLAIAPASQQGTALANVQLAAQVSQSAVVLATAAAPHGLVPGQAITVAGAGAPYDGNQSVQNTGLTDSSLTAQQFTFVAPSSPSNASSGSVTPTESGVIASSATTLVAEITSGTAPSPGAAVQLSGVPMGSFSSDINAPYTVQTIPAIAGLPATAVSLATITDQTFTVGSTSGGGILATPVFIAPPSVPGGEFYVIAAPKDWLANQTVATANADAMVTWWDDTIAAFFASGNYLQVAIGTTTSFTGVSNGTQFAFYTGLSTTGTPAFSILKPVPSNGQTQSLANATWVWAQAGIPANQQGTVWDQIVQAFCRGVAMAGVSTSVPTTTGQSNTAWTSTANWYTGTTSTSRYCPFSKFLHYSTLQGTTAPLASSIYTSQLAYGFSEDETPLGTNGAAISTGVPSKMDGTVPDGATLTLTVGSFGVRAQAYAVMEAGIVIEVVMLDPGSGYVVPPTVEITPPGPNGMTATAVATVANGQVTQVTMTSQGSGYDFGPQVSFLR